jgi:hemerythrin
VGFPDYPRHRELHVAFGAEIAALKARLMQEGPNPILVSAIRMFVSNWLVDHISNVDRNLARFVNTGER